MIAQSIPRPVRRCQIGRVPSAACAGTRAGACARAGLTRGALLQYIPDDFVFKSTETQPLWSSEDGTADAMEIREHSEVRVRVLGSSMDPHTVVRPHPLPGL